VADSFEQLAIPGIKLQSQGKHSENITSFGCVAISHIHREIVKVLFHRQK